MEYKVGAGALAIAFAAMVSIPPEAKASDRYALV